MHRFTIAAALILAALSASSCVQCRTTNASNSSAAPAKPTLTPIPPPSLDAAAPAEYAGLHNVVTYAPNLICGSVPEGAEGFETLRAMGVRTIISVDGADPDIASAHAQGLRYIHLPIGYNGMDQQRTLEIAKAIQESEASGPVYIHCHHGKHRSAGAAGAACVTLGYLDTDQATAKLKVSGTAPNYKGLYKCVAVAMPATPAQLRAVPDNFPEIAPTPGLVKAMVEVDDAFDHLKAIETAGWKTPSDHPDLVPAAEAGRLSDLLRNVSDDPKVKSKPEEFAQWLASASERAASLEDGLASGSLSPEDLRNRYKLVGASCKECHAKYRD